MKQLRIPQYIFYLLLFSIFTFAGNEANTTRTITIIDVTPPVITLNGEANVSLFVGIDYTELGATAQDAVEGNVSVAISGNVGTSVVGKYTITYTATDSAGNSATLSRIIDVQALTIDQLINKIENNEIITPELIVFSLKAYYKKFNEDSHVAMAIPLSPIFILLYNNYDKYKSIILDMYRDKTNHQFLRLPMLELIEYHLDDTASLDTVKKVFFDTSDDSLVVGKSAKVLSKKGIDISEDVEKRYPNSDEISKPIYAKILASLKPSSSRAMIEKDMDNEKEGNNKIKLIGAFAQTGINDDYVVNKLENMLYNTIPINYDDLEAEIISVAIIMNLGESNRDDRFVKLIDIATSSLFSLITRASALDELYFGLPKSTTINKDDIKFRLQKLSQKILSSANDFKDEAYQNLLNEQVLDVINILEDK